MIKNHHFDLVQLMVVTLMRLWNGIGTSLFFLLNSVWNSSSDDFRMHEYVKHNKYFRMNISAGIEAVKNE